MKVTAYIQFSDDPFKNLVQFDAIKLNIDGKNGTVLITTAILITGLESQLAEDREGCVYEFNAEDIVDFTTVDTIYPDPVKPERKPYTKKSPLPIKSTKTTVDKVKAKTAKNKAAVITEPNGSIVLEKTGKEISAEVEKAVTKKEIRPGSVSFPVHDVLKSLRLKAIISNRSSGTIAAVATKMGLTEDWHTFLGLMTRSEWLKQDGVGDGVIAILEALYKKSGIELKD